MTAAVLEVMLPEPVIRMPEDITWRTRGSCVKPGINVDNFWADPTSNPRAVTIAKRICETCPAQVDCLDYALATGERHGVWGGVDELERRRVARGVHGTPERYRARRCRCDDCAAAFDRQRALQRNAETLLVEALSLSMVP